MHISPYLSLIGHSKVELTDVDISFKKKNHWLFDNNETDQGADCLTDFEYVNEMNNFFCI